MEISHQTMIDTEQRSNQRFGYLWISPAMRTLREPSNLEGWAPAIWGKTIGKPIGRLENPRETIGKPWENGGLPSGSVYITMVSITMLFMGKLTKFRQGHGFRCATLVITRG